jgi:predicted DNA-binding transcriptional regulator YafY
MRDDFRRSPSTEIVLRVRPPRLPMVLRSLSVTALGAADPVRDEPGAVRLQVRSLYAAAAMLVGFGTEVGVISPPELRDHIVAIAEDTLEHHRRPPQPT